jgi:hypothetical protein
MGRGTITIGTTKAPIISAKLVIDTGSALSSALHDPNLGSLPNDVALGSLGNISPAE